MTQVRVWFLNESVGWFKYTTLESHASCEDTVRCARELIHEALPRLKKRTGRRTPAVAYEVVREDG